MATKTAMKMSAIAPWFGSKRTLAPRIVTELGEHKFYFEGCVGSCAVLLAKEPAHHEAACDLHGALTNLAWCVQDKVAAETLFDRLSRTLYSDAVYEKSKNWLARWELGEEIPLTSGLQRVDEGILDWAYHYFIASWMGRNGTAGTERINYQIATRWTPGGGSGPLRFKSAIDSIPAWCERLRNVHIMRRCMFECLEKLEDGPSAAIYVDPPYLEEGGDYLHGPDDSLPIVRQLLGLETESGASLFGEQQLPPYAWHRALAMALRRFENARVVVSYYAHPLLGELYPGWTQIDCSRQKNLHVQNRRGMGASVAPEVLLVNGKAYQ